MTERPLNVDDNGEVHVRPFADWLREQSRGATHDELGESLHDLVGRVQDTGKKGTLTLTITIAPLKNDTGVLVVTDEIKLKLPEHDRAGTIFYPDDTGNLTREDPRQLKFDSLREVPNRPTPRDPSTSTQEQQA